MFLRYLTALTWLALMYSANDVFGEPLGRIPQVDLGQARLIHDAQSDIWTSPTQQKDDPLRRYLIGVKLPLVRRSDWNASVSVDAEGLRIARPDLVVGDDRIEVLTDLRTQSLGVGAGRQDANGGWSSFFATFESASDEPFKDRRDRYLTATAVHAFEPRGSWQWVLGANYSRNRGIYNGRPMPIAGFFYRPNSQFSIALGFPYLFVEWKAEKNLVVSLVSTQVGAEVSFRRDLTKDFFYQLKTGIAEHSYLHTQRIEDAKRLFFEEKYFAGGIGMRLSPTTTTVVSVGRSYDRRVYEGYRVFSKIGPDQAIKSDYYGILRLEFDL